MEVIKSSLLIIFLIAFISCAKEQIAPKGIFDGNTKTSGECVNKQIKGEYIVNWKNGSYSLEKALSDQHLWHKFVKPRIDEIESVYYNYKITLDTPVVNYAGENETWGQEAIEVQNLWDQNIQGENEIVAVVDTGVNLSHVQLAEQIFKNQVELNGKANVDDDGNGRIDDVSGWDFVENNANVIDPHGHGSHVAGIVSAMHLTSSPAKGLAPKAKILPLRFMDENGNGDIKRALDAISYARTMGAKIINASWGGADCSLDLFNQVKSLEGNNILFVAAAGNSGQDIAYSPVFPAAFHFEHQLTVGASTVNFMRASFSNYGTSVHILAPGKNILSTYKGTNELIYLSGTSMAAPFVAGLAALLRSAKPDASVQEIKTAIMKGVKVGNFYVESKGEINARCSLAFLKNPSLDNCE